MIDPRAHLIYMARKAVQFKECGLPRPDASDAFRVLSRARLARYLELANGDLEGALLLYRESMKLNRAFYEPLQVLEVSFRNAVAASLDRRFGAAWHLSQDFYRIAGRHVTVALITANDNLRRDRAIDHPEASHVVAHLSFGFWCQLLSKRFEVPIWRLELRRAFPGAPVARRREDVRSAAERQRALRNRVAHHEPIHHMALRSEAEAMFELMAWVAPELSVWRADMSAEVDAALRHAPIEFRDTVNR